MSTTIPTQQPNDLPTRADHTLPSFSLSQSSSILNLLNTKCANSFENLQQVHSLILKTGIIQDHYVSGSLVKCYANPHFSSLSNSLQVLRHVSEPNVFVYNCIIKGCLDNEEPLRAISLYCDMVISGARPNKFTYSPLFKACTEENCAEEGRQLHCQVVKRGFCMDKHITSAAIQMYASLGRFDEARNLLDSNGSSDFVCCNALIDGYMKLGEVNAAREVFEKMREKSVGSWNTMVTGFARNDMMDEAKKYFDEMPVKDGVSWSAMIDGLNRGGYFKEALEVFNQMREVVMEIDQFILSSVLATCANLSALDQGKWIHAYIRRNGFWLDAVLGTSLIDMYAKSGPIDLAWVVFEEIKCKEVFSWNAMIGGLAMHGRADDAIKLFSKMGRLGVKASEVTFTALLNACAHAGLVDDGLKYFHAMREKYEIGPTMEHYGCVVNILGKAGFLNAAEDFIKSMPMTANGAVWGALLGACKVHGNVEMGKRVGEILLELEPENSGRYVLLSNIYAKAGKWGEVERIRRVMKERGVRTEPGMSTVEVNGVVHEFRAGDLPNSCVHLMLEKIVERIGLNGYKAITSEVLIDVSEEEKERSLVYHSEKIAIAFGVMNIKPGVTIRIVSSLRMCEDCHSAMKIISDVYEREIITRDRVRFHHFKRGKCSCLDFW